jgi:hypothetical protein
MTKTYGSIGLVGCIREKCRLVGDLGNYCGQLWLIRDGKARIARGLRQMEVAVVCAIGGWLPEFHVAPSGAWNHFGGIVYKQVVPTELHVRCFRERVLQWIGLGFGEGSGGIEPL